MVIAQEILCKWQEYFPFLNSNGMLRKYYIFIWSFIAMNINAFANIPDEEFFVLDREMRGVKIITEKSFSKWQTVSYFDNEGFLLRKINYYKNKMRSDYRYEYSMSDALLEIKEKEYLNINNNQESYIIHKYYYNYIKQCYRVESYSSKDLEKPGGILDNFIYKDSLLQYYERGTFPHTDEHPSSKTLYIYNNRKQMIRKLNIDYASIDMLLYSPDFASTDTTFYSFVYDKEGRLTDFITESSNERAVFTGVICWSREKVNKLHIRYSNFDRRGNWTRSHFITEKGRVFRSKRKIKY